jgi:hypothetical protein
MKTYNDASHFLAENIRQKRKEEIVRVDLTAEIIRSKNVHINNEAKMKLLFLWSYSNTVPTTVRTVSP